MRGAREELVREYTRGELVREMILGQSMGRRFKVIGRPSMTICHGHLRKISKVSIL